MIRSILTTLTSLAAAALLTAASAQTTIDKRFVDAPQSVFPLLDRTTRLDMIDYFNSGMSTPSTNNLNGKSRITSMSPQKIEFSVSDASDYAIALLPAGADNITAVVTTVKNPAPDSRIDFYSPTWTHLATTDYFAAPGLEDWLTEKGKKQRADVEAFVPFVLISYDYNPATATLTLTNNTAKFLAPDIFELVEGCLKPTISYTWNGKKFKQN